MPKKTPGKKNGSDDTPGAGDAATTTATAAAESSSLRSPREERQRTWARRADDAVAALQQVQQLLLQHSADVDTTKQNLDQVISTATLLWAMDVEELPPQYRDRSRPTSQRVGSSASARGGSASEQRSALSSKQSQRANGRTPDSDTTVASVPETVESAIRQLSPAQRSKVSNGLQALFYAPISTAAATGATPIATPVSSPTGPNAMNGKGDVPLPRMPLPHQRHSVDELSPSSPSAAAADTDSVAPTENVRRANNNNNSTATIPAPLLTVMKDLQGRRIQLEAQLAVATSATAQQLHRSQLLQEEVMVAQYALEALRSEAGHSQTQL
jgi:hypothetical protein